MKRLSSHITQVLGSESNNDAHNEGLDVGDEGFSASSIHPIHIRLPIEFNIIYPKIVHKIGADVEDEVEQQKILIRCRPFMMHRLVRSLTRLITMLRVTVKESFEADDEGAGDNLHLQHNLLVIEYARILHHVHMIQLVHPLIIQFVGRDISIHIIKKPLLRILWHHDIFLVEVSLLIRPIIVLLLQRQRQLDALELYEPLPVHELPFRGPACPMVLLVEVKGDELDDLIGQET